MLLSLKSLFTDLSAYLRLSSESLGETLKLSLTGLALLAGINGAAQAISNAPQLFTTLTQYTDAAVQWWPDTQVLEWRAGRATVLPHNPDLRHVSWPVPPPAELPAQLLVYSPNTVTEPDQRFLRGAESSFLLVSPDTFWLNLMGETWSEPLPLATAPGLQLLPDGSYDRAAVVQRVGETHRALRSLLLVGLFSWPLLSILGSWLSMAWFAVTEAALIWLISRFFGTVVSWPRLIKLNLLLVIPATAVQTLARWMYPELTFSLFHITYWLLLTLLFLVGSAQLSRSNR